MNREEWACKLMQASLEISTSWHLVLDDKKCQWLRAADIVISEQKKLLAIEETLKDLNKSVPPFSSVNELYGWSEVCLQYNIILDAFMRVIYPKLEDTYGTPVDGLQRVLKAIIHKEITITEKLLNDASQISHEKMQEIISCFPERKARVFIDSLA